HLGAVLDVEAHDRPMGAPVGVLGGPAAADVLPAQTLPPPEAALEEGLIGGDLEPAGARDRPGGVAGARQRRGDDDVGWGGGDGAGERLGLVPTVLVQGDVDLPLQAALPVVLGLA